AGVVRAVINIGLQLARINEIVDSASLPQGSAISIVNENGIIVARTGHPEWTGRDVSQEPIVIHRRGSRDKIEEMVWFDGITRVTATGLARAAPWVVTVGLPTVQQSAAFERAVW